MMPEIEVGQESRLGSDPLTVTHCHAGKWGEGPLSPLPVKAVAMYDPVVFGRGVPAVLKVEKE